MIPMKPDRMTSSRIIPCGPLAVIPGTDRKDVDT